MKKFLKIAIVSLLILLIGCTKAENEKKYVVGFSQFTSNDDWRKSMNQSMKIEANFHDNMKLLILDGKGSIDKQIADVEELINKKVDVLLISPIAPKPLKASINKAIEAGIPVIILDRNIEDVNYNSFIGVNNYEVGLNAAEYIVSLKKKAKIVEIKSWAGTVPTIQKSLGFNEAVEKNNDLTIVGTTQDSYNGSGIKKHFKQILEENDGVDFVFAHTDALALQAYEVAKELGLTDQIKFIGVGGVNSPNGGINLVERKILEATVFYPTGGKEAINIAMKIINKENVGKNYALPSLIIDADNVDVLKRGLELISSQELDIEKQQSKINDQLQLYSSQRDFLKYTLLFLGLIGLLLFLTLRAKQTLSKQKKLLEELIDKIANQKTEIEEIAENLRVTNEATNNFFTGVSHDFKTPLSLILSSTESLLSKGEEKKPEEFGLIYNNSKRLLRMINQLLDFRRVESKKFRLKAAKTNIYSFVKSIFSDFKNEAEKNKIDFSLTTNTNEAELYIDRDLLDNVLFNLLSNAFKFTPIKGKVSINIDEADEGIFISVKDSGIGIVAAEKDKIFNQFFLGSNNKQTSSGIGLYLAKQYAKLHGGSLEVFSTEGKGAEFKIYIPKGKAHFKPEEIIVGDEINTSETIDLNAFTFEENEETVPDENKESLLIIEDNTDLRGFLKSKLSETYNVYESDGIDAVNKAIEIIPDIIISDVNLPEKNGFEICEALRNDIRTSHIPTIILTALTSDAAHLQGLKSGVDMFLTKPFNLSVLNQSLKTLLYNRKRLQHFYKQSFSIEENRDKKEIRSKKDKQKDVESEFFKTINNIVQKSLDDSTFTVEILAEELKISRVQLYRKTKAVLGINISDYIQNIRLEKSKELLQDKELTIADVAYSTGFSSPNYFSTSFKNKYGKSPNQYKKDKK
ncbi:monosaccharide ABC transporter substrate-binding protein (CUT2 family) [Tenacibaculum adriaticum]|uniref:histidine kinase n=1 Tax=Tenacibaculum adriaticum TaxID=413713 RepID=A0A5S5DWS2_9FLAO|nr:substrate-binding domain-containing protein [Tenacibaculum adriaticum]TYQ00388.1 monosaccharide ABC transporter substrate-binding protein (CUT2 family) [Tenacibaculum adriaticum]